MTFDRDLEDLMTTTVIYAGSTGLSLSGAQTFSTSPLTIQARIEPGSRLVRDQTGREVVSEITVFLKPTSTTGSTYTPDVKGRLTLPSQYASTATPPQIIRVRIHNDAESQGGGPHHYEVSL